MDEQYEISVIISSYNRSQMLASALDSVLEQDACTVPYEVIVVDNNSTDQTRQVVESYISRGHKNLSYVFEPRQGVSYARNTGIGCARAQIIAFADDDVRVAKDWVANIKRAFDLHPDVDFLGGKILPRWSSDPPAWLTRDHWWALALLDYGDEPFYVSADNPLCLPTANASFRRDVFSRSGLFSPNFSGREDHELLVRLWRGGSRGIYVPDIVVIAEVQPERLKRDYHRRWNITTGKFNSLMRLNEIMGPDGRITGEPPDLVTLFGVPGFVYRGLFVESLGWIRATLLGRRTASLHHNNRVWYFIGYISKRYEQKSEQRRQPAIFEVGSFIKALLHKKLKLKVPRE